MRTYINVILLASYVLLVFSGLFFLSCINICVLAPSVLLVLSVLLFFTVAPAPARGGVGAQVCQPSSRFPARCLAEVPGRVAAPAALGAVRLGRLACSRQRYLRWGLSGPTLAWHDGLFRGFGSGGAGQVGIDVGLVPFIAADHYFRHGDVCGELCAVPVGVQDTLLRLGADDGQNHVVVASFHSCP